MNTTEKRNFGNIVAETSNYSTAMIEQHPSVSAVGSHLDELTKIAALAQRYYEEEGHPEGVSRQGATRHPSTPRQRVEASHG